MTSGAGSDLQLTSWAPEAAPWPRLLLAPGQAGGDSTQRTVACSEAPRHQPPASPGSESGSRFCVFIKTKLERSVKFASMFNVMVNSN